MKKIIAGLVVLVGVSNTALAQDDVSIMDLKETTYYLMKDVTDMKAKQGKVLSEMKTVSISNNNKLASTEVDVSRNTKAIKEMQAKEILKNYKVSSKLQNYLK